MINVDAMKALLHRLFSEAPKLDVVEGQAPALHCHVTLTTGAMMTGVLSTTQEGTLRMLADSPVYDEHQRPVLVEHFFPFESLACVSVRRDVTPTRPSPRIHTA